MLVLVAGSVVTAPAQNSAVRVNGLGIATGTLNVGLDVGVSQRWSVEGSVYWNPIKGDSFRSQAAAFSLGARYWRYEPHVGPFFGFHNTTIFYNAGTGGKFYKGWMTGLGASYGYSWMLSTRWNLTAEFGLGCFYMKDRRRRPHSDNEDIYVYHHQRLVVAPSRAEISFSYLF